jgi:hypothetical protein
MKISKLLAVGALALACLVFASPAVTAADIVDHPACGFELIDTSPAVLDADVCVIDLSADHLMLASLSPRDDDAARNCSNSPAWAGVRDTWASKYTAERLPACGKHYDPGWRAS